MSIIFLHHLKLATTSFIHYNRFSPHLKIIENIRNNEVFRLYVQYIVYQTFYNQYHTDEIHELAFLGDEIQQILKSNVVFTCEANVQWYIRVDIFQYIKLQCSDIDKTIYNG